MILALIHTCTIKRRTDSIVSQEVVEAADTTIATNVPCLFQFLADSGQTSVLGQGTQTVYELLLEPTANVQLGDLIEWPLESLFFTVRGFHKVQGMHAEAEDHIALELAGRDVQD